MRMLGLEQRPIHTKNNYNDKGIDLKIILNIKE